MSYLKGKLTVELLRDIHSILERRLKSYAVPSSAIDSLTEEALEEVIHFRDQGGKNRTERHEVALAFRRLDVFDAELLRLRVGMGMSYESLAKATGLTEQEAKKRVSRAFARLAASQDEGLPN